MLQLAFRLSVIGWTVLWSFILLTGTLFNLSQIDQKRPSGVMLAVVMKR